MQRIKIISFIVCSFICCFCSAQVGNGLDALPSNIGGNSELKRIFKQELRYPAVSLKKKEGGKIKIDFVIQKDSSITDVRIKTSVSPSIDAEALRIFHLIQWVPVQKKENP